MYISGGGGDGTQCVQRKPERVGGVLFLCLCHLPNTVLSDISNHLGGGGGGGGGGLICVGRSF